MYRPKFCAECGEKIVRLHWRVWTSRMFCDDCAPRLIREQLIRIAAASVAILLIGIVIGHATRRTQPPVVTQRVSEARQNLAALPSNSSNTPPAPVEEIYTCGARTKKGTPCSRRVHGPVRCWQHKGMPAMLAQEKLHIKE
jgi:hypothetical protein